MKASGYIILLIIACLLSCDKGPNCDYGAQNPCEEDWGLIYPKIQMKEWVPYKDGNTVSFINDSGDRIRFQPFNYWEGYGGSVYYSIDTVTRCCDYINVTLENTYIGYEAKHPAFPGDLRVYVGKDISTLTDVYRSVSSRAEYLQKENATGDILEIIIGGKDFTYLIPDSAATKLKLSTHEYLKDKKLGPHNYPEVLHLYNSGADTTMMAAKGIYYIKNKGLVGYYLNNGEEWWLE
jgi:hypothetical protein